MPARNTAELLDLLLRFLYTILAEDCGACGNRLLDPLKINGLGHDHELNGRRISTCTLCRRNDPVAHRLEVVSN